MAAITLLRQIAYDSYENKVKASHIAFNEVKNYLLKFEKPAIAYEMTMYVCLFMFASDYQLSKKEATFFNDFLDTPLAFKEFADEYKKFRLAGYQKAFDYLKNAPVDTKKRCAILAACCVTCDRDIQNNEIEDFERLLKCLSLTI